MRFCFVKEKSLYLGASYKTKDVFIRSRLFTYSCFFCRNEKGLLNFTSERIKLVYRVNNTRYNFQKNKLPFKHLKPQFIGRILLN